MPRTVKPLSELAVRTATPATNGKVRKLFDGNGLQLWIMPDGKKYWRADIRLHGARKEFAIGPYPTIGLAKARQEAAAARALAKEGIDPSAQRRAKSEAQSAAKEHTFEAVARRVIAQAKKRGRADQTLQKKEWLLAKFSASFRNTPIATIELPELKRQLNAHNQTGTGEIASRMKMLLSQTFRFAAQDGLIKYNPTHDLKDVVDRKATTHHKAILKPERFAELLRLIDGYAERNVVTGSALQLMALLYQRPGELRAADWSEFDLKAALWNIPAGRMKMRRPHTVNLPRQAIAILQRLKDITGPEGFVFPSIGKKVGPMSENTLNQALRNIGIPKEEHSSHGFRATASTLLNASGKWSPDVIEISLSHKNPDKVRLSYNRGTFELERARMAQWWADNLDTLRGGPVSNVVALSR